MNGPNSPIADAEGILTIDDGVKYGEKKKLSLTLPLLNVVFTRPDNDEKINDNDSNAQQMDISTEQTSSKMKKMYESTDDVFIQTIFSQTIKSTTATPSDDEPSQAFDPFKRLPSSPSQDDIIPVDSPTDDNQIDDETAEIFETAEVISINEPTGEPMFTYFHQTIEEDEPPTDLTELPTELITNLSPTNIINVANNINNDDFINTNLSESDISGVVQSNSNLNTLSLHSTESDDEATDSLTSCSDVSLIHCSVVFFFLSFCSIQ